MNATQCPASVDPGPPPRDTKIGADAPPPGGRGKLAFFLFAITICWYLFQHRERFQRLVQKFAANYLGAAPPPSIAAGAGGPGGGEGVDAEAVVRKLSALNAKLYGVDRCSWTTKQLDAFGPAKEKARTLYVDCAAEPDMCAKKVTHFPNWEIDGKLMPAGMVELHVLNAQCDAMLVAEREAANVAPKPKPDPDVSASEAEADGPLTTPPPPSPVVSVTEEEEEEQQQKPVIEEEVQAEKVVVAAPTPTEAKATEEAAAPPPPPPTPTPTPAEAAKAEEEEEEAPAPPPPPEKKPKRRRKRG